MGRTSERVEVSANGHAVDDGTLRTFGTGATRDSSTGKPDYAGFLSPDVIRRFGQYMHRHRVQPDGSLRPSNNWKKGIPKDVYVSSLFRHFVDVWTINENGNTVDHNGQPVDVEDALCAILFNAAGYLHEHLRENAAA